MHAREAQICSNMVPNTGWRLRGIGFEYFGGLRPRASGIYQLHMLEYPGVPSGCLSGWHLRSGGFGLVFGIENLDSGLRVLVPRTWLRTLKVLCELV